MLCYFIHLFSQLITVLDIHCCVTHHSKTWWFQTTTVIFFMSLVSVGQTLKGSDGWFWFRVSDVVSSQVVAGAGKVWGWSSWGLDGHLTLFI